MAFSESFLQELADRNDIVDVVGSYVHLNKRSGANLFGLCPFHSEKTPSFSVSPDKQIYHCFGCGKGGSVINFIMEIEGLSFPEAVEFLARRAGMEMPEDTPDASRHRRERMLALNRDAARFFFQQLTLPSGKPAQDYIVRRQISPAMTKAFGLGFAPDTWDSLTRAMNQKGYTDDELADAGLVRRGKSGRGVYDTFRNRLMFPVIDVRGNVIGFSGRILDDGEPKYMNSPETLVFNKSRNLFALNIAKKSKLGYIILAEGNVDVVSLHQAGFDCAVASLGTSLTPEQARLISRYTNEVIIAYDSDGAGQKASQRAIGILEKLDLKVRVLQLPQGKDPDEFIKLKGADAFKNLLERTENHIEYRLQQVQKKYDMSVDEEKVACLKESAQVIAQLPSSVEREVYSMRLADFAGINKAVVTDEVERSRKRLLAKAKKQYEKDATRIGPTAHVQRGGIKYENRRSALAEEGVVRLYYLDPSLFQGKEIEPEDFSSPLLARFYTVLREKAAGTGELSMASLGESFSAEEVSHLTSVLQKPDVLSNAAQALDDYIEIIKNEKQKIGGNEDLRALAEQMRNRKRYGG
jgi:DNA primase